MIWIEEDQGIIKDGAWEGYPTLLRDMFVELSSDDKVRYEVRDAIEYLAGALQAADGLNAESKTRRVFWVGEFFVMCTNPVFREDEWLRCAEPALSLARQAEQILLGMFPEAERPIPDDELPETSEVNIRCLRQDLLAGGCVAAGLAGQKGEFTLRLEKIVEANELDVHLEAKKSRALLYGEAEPGTRYAECFSNGHFWTGLLAYVADSAPYMHLEAEVAEALRNYISYLNGAMRWGAPFRSYLMEAHKRLDRLMKVQGEFSEGRHLTPLPSTSLVSSDEPDAASKASVFDEEGPDYPLDFSAAEEIRRVIAGNPALPIAVFASPGGAMETFCEGVRVEVTQLLNRDTSWWPFVLTSRDDLVAAIENEIRDLCCVEDWSPDWGDSQIAAAAEREAAKFDDSWIPVIAIHVKWSERQNGSF